MKLNKKGFAITSIIYSMLILFLTLVLLIISNLASRKAVFDKEKNEILERINNEEPICTLAEGGDLDSSGTVTVGAKYTCDPGDGTSRTFYVLESGDNVSLIMDSNINDTSVAWGAYQETTSSTALTELQVATSTWTVDVSMPTFNQILAADEITTFQGQSLTNEWLFLNTDTYGYWTATSMDDGNAYGIKDSNLSPALKTSGTTNGVRPVITVAKNKLG